MFFESVIFVFYLVISGIFMGVLQSDLEKRKKNISSIFIFIIGLMWPVFLLIGVFLNKTNFKSPRKNK